MIEKKRNKYAGKVLYKVNSFLKGGGEKFKFLEIFIFSYEAYCL